LKILPDFIAVILCAGEGTRIKDYSNDIPKPLIKIENVSILELLLNSLYQLGIGRVVLVKGHLGHKIDEFANDYRERNRIYPEDLIIVDAKEDYKLGPLHSLLSIKSLSSLFKKGSYYIVIPGDVIYDINLLQDLISNITQRSDDRSIVFYREINIDTLNKKDISIAYIGEAYSSKLLKQIVKVNLEQYSGDKTVKQIIPLLFSNYDFIQNILQFDQVKSIDTLRKAINISINNGYNINPVKVQSQKNFYDIDSESDLEDYKKRREKRQ